MNPTLCLDSAWFDKLHRHRMFWNILMEPTTDPNFHILRHPDHRPHSFQERIHTSDREAFCVYYERALRDAEQ